MSGDPGVLCLEHILCWCCQESIILLPIPWRGVIFEASCNPGFVVCCIACLVTIAVSPLPQVAGAQRPTALCRGACR
jgi:hypothetical protein